MCCDCSLIPSLYNSLKQEGADFTPDEPVSTHPGYSYQLIFLPFITLTIDWLGELINFLAFVVAKNSKTLQQ